MGVSRFKEMAVGIIFFTAMGILGFYTVVVGELAVLEEPVILMVHFEDAAGLKEGNDVRISGVDVGKVVKLDLSPGGVIATLQVNRPLQEVQLHEDYEIKIRPFSPLGGSYVDVQRGDPRKPALEASRYEDLKGTAQPNALEGLSRMVDKSSQNVVETTRLVRQIMENLAEGKGTMGMFLNDPRIYDSLYEVTNNMESVTSDLSDISARINRGDGLAGRLTQDEETSERFATTIANLEKTSARAQETMDNLASVTGKIDRGEGTAGALINEKQAHDELVALLKNTNASMTEVKTLVANLNEGKGTAGQLLTNEGLYTDLRSSTRSLNEVLQKVEGAEGPLGVMLSDEDAAERLRNIFANVESSTADVRDITGYIRSGQGNLGRIVYGSELVDEARRTLIELRESTEDLREQAPINAFIGAVMGAL